MKSPEVPLAAIPYSTETIVGAAVLFTLLILFRSPLTVFLKKVFGFKSEKAVSDILFDPDKAAKELDLALESKLSEATGALGESSAKIVQSSASAKDARRFSRAEILWVEAHPNGNIHERLALEALGIRFTLAPSTRIAMGVVGQRAYAAIISEFGRPPGNTSATKLLEALRERDDQTPFIFYARPAAFEPHRAAMEEENLNFTSDPVALFRFITAAVVEPPRAAAVR